MSFIGGNLQDIEASAARLVDSGAMAVSSGADTHGAALVLADAVDQAMSQLVARFEGIADSLSAEIAQSHAVLAGSNWQGKSRENAVIMKEELLAQVNAVLGSATANLSSEKATFIARSQSLVEAVQTDFQRVMSDVDAQYAGLADAARRTRENLELADQTIRFG